MPLDVIINGARGGTWVLVERGGSLYAPRDAFEEWRLAIAADAPRVEFKGQEYFALSAVPGFRSKVDLANQSVELTFSPQAFAVVRMSQELAKKPEAGPVLPSAFLNYDLSYQRSSFRSAPTVGDLGALTELGVSTGLGVFTTSSALRNALDDRNAGFTRKWIRLESTFTRDFPGSNLTLRLGDATTKPAMWGRDVYFGGVRLGTNFALTPGFISQPLPTLAGMSAAPSTVELYVNDVLRQVSSVPTGPFTIDNFPVLTGGGEARIVVRDLLGRENVVVQRFFTSPQMLARGLDDWSFEAGKLRLELGNESAEYGAGFASGTWRRGLTDRLTVEGRTELSRRVKNLGFGMVAALPWDVVGRAALVGSHSELLGRGGRWLLGLEHQGVYGGVTLEAQRSSPVFREIGQVDASATRYQYAGSFTYATESFGTVGLGYAEIGRYDGLKATTLSGNYSVRVGERGTLTFTATRVLDGPTGSAYGVTYLLPLDSNRSASVTANRRGDVDDLYASAVQNAGIDGAIGWRALAGMQQDRARAEGGVYYQGLRGNLSADVAYSPEQKTVRLGANGGLVFAARNFFATRRVDESFAVAEVPGYANIGIGVGSNVLARTNSAGIALVPRLLPYMPNSIRINPRELPINAEITSIERTVVPSWRSAIKVDFPVRSGRGALLKIVLDDGEVAPAGAVVNIAGEEEEFYVARRGEAFVTGLMTTTRLRLRWKERQCLFDATLPPEKIDEIPRVGPIACKGVPR